MDSLPDEVLLMIFDELTTREVLYGPARVCRRWGRLSRLRILWVRINRDVDKLRTRLHAIFISTRLDSLNEFLVRTALICPHLRELTVHSMMLFHYSQMNALARLRLKHLDVFIQGQVCDRRMVPVASGLTTLVINENVAPGFFSELMNSCRFRSLQMFGRALFYPKAELLALLRMRWEHLVELTLRCPELTCNAYEAIGLCVNLTSLQLYSCWMMTGEAALEVVRPSKLRRLHITGTFMVRDRALAKLIDRLPVALHELVLSSSCFGDEHVVALSSRLKHIQLLELWSCNLSPNGAAKLAHACPSLLDLDLDLELVDSDIDRFAKHPNLKRLRCRPVLDTNHDPVRTFPSFYHSLKVTPSFMRYACKYFRDGGEGFRANLFYYSIQDRELEALPPNADPAWFDDNPYF